ncbi:hypothetical protein [Pantoea vagans]|uniref:hypothetical protein n=1 Tax=Pantoea vagans TaxID=470934 RepID=UPI00289A90F0|nr:hypothetical protein [Pantoea vagans]
MNILSVDFQGTNARGMDGMAARFINTPNGKRRVTAGPLIKALTIFMQERNAKAFDAGLQVAKSRIADNAIAAALIQSNQQGQLSNVRAIDSMFDVPAAAPQPKGMDILDAIDGIVPHKGKCLSLDQAIDGVTPAPRESITKFIDQF